VIDDLPKWNTTVAELTPEGQHFADEHDSADRQIIGRYLEWGFSVVQWPCHGDQKGPTAPGWQHHPITSAAEYHDGYRLGILTGTEIQPGRYLADVDIDWAAGLPVAQKLLPASGFAFGHASKRVSHIFYTTSEALTSFKYDDIDKTTLIELRGTKTDGSIGLQSMAPPSIWSKEGKREPLNFVRCERPAHLDDASRLKSPVKLAAIGMMLAKHLGKHGFGHETRLAWAGFLLRAGVAEDDLITMGEGMSAYCHNREVGDVRTVVQSQVAALATKGKKIKGGPALAKILGDNGKAILARINEWLGLDTNTIHMVGGQLTEIVDRAEEALLATAIYQRGGLLTRVITLDKPLGGLHDVRRPAGSTMLIGVREPWLVEQMGRALQWKKINAKGEAHSADPAPLYARTLLHRSEWRFPVLRGVVTAPTLAADGRIIEVPGLDEVSGLLLNFDSNSFPLIPVHPSKDDAHLALARLSAPLRGFPFIDEAARAVALSALLTALIRSSLRTAPMHCFDAPAAGTGKSLMAEVPGLLATGVKPPALSQGKTPEEDEKRLSTVLFAGDPVIHIDNCEQPITGDFLCSMLTQEIVQARILGLSERRILPCTALVCASGNNLTLAGDASRRAVICRLDAQVERPDTRVFDFDCHAEVRANRARLVVDGLTILLAYHVAERPSTLTPMGSFDDYEWIRGALVWLGCADPADTRIGILDADPHKDELISVMQLWEKAWGTTSVEVASIQRRATELFDDGEPVEARETREAMSALRDQLIEVTGKKVWSGKAVGWWLRRNKDRVVNGRCFRNDRDRLWTLVVLKKGEKGA
jgi:hypothetical protein